MRLLDSVMGIMNLSELSMPAKVESSVRQILGLPQGMLLVTGPTGSGKSTTLYAALNLLRASAGNVVTVEDPVEYVLPGINQVHVNNKAGLTFSSCLRSILRQDPKRRHDRGDSRQGNGGNRFGSGADRPLAALESAHE
jgi:type II secretory ATPase GspE/PulE/Tfp pilus assembly ATPase PilB-like protein